MKIKNLRYVEHIKESDDGSVIEIEYRNGCVQKYSMTEGFGTRPNEGNKK